MADVESEVGRRAARVRREMLRLASLIAIAVLGFFFTRAVAAVTAEAAGRDAARWYAAGQAALAGGRFDEAAADLRRAVARRRGEPGYVLDLARALAAGGDTAAARRELSALRERIPEDPDVNLELARLAAADASPGEARRFYYNALYAPWPPERADLRRRIRLELIRLLLREGEKGRALSELLAVAAETPDDGPRQREVAQLFEMAGDASRALQHFEQALRRQPADRAALAGAGLAAYQLGSYPQALDYLRRVPDAAGEIATTREVLELMAAEDPRAPRLGAVERRRRLTAVVGRARERLVSCAAVQSAGAAALLAGLDAAARPLTSRAALDQDEIDTALEAVDRSEAAVIDRCGPATPLDRSLVLIARRRHPGAS